MTRQVVAFFAGALASGLLWPLCREVFAAPVLARRNVRGIDVPTAGGIVVVLALLLVAVVSRALWGWWELEWAADLLRASSVLWVVGVFAFLGLVDDVLATGHERGFRGHVGALLRGRLTTGGLKLLGGGLAALILTFQADDLWRSLVDAAVIALAANTANLLDRAPGRVTKTAMLVLAVMLGVNAIPQDLATVTLVMGATFGLLVPELDERVMLGDTGVNPLGAAFGIGVVQTAGTWVTLAVLVVLVALNVVSERVSFSAVIARNPVLRWYDELGRRTDPA